MNQYAKLAASGALFASLFYLVLTGKIQASDYQTLAVGALGAVGGWHAASRPKSKDQSPDAGKMVGAPLLLPQLQNHIEDKLGMVNSQVKPDPIHQTQENP